MSDLYTFTDDDVLDVIDATGYPLSVTDVARRAVATQLRTDLLDDRVETVLKVRGTGRFRTLLYGLRDAGVLLQYPTSPRTYGRPGETP